MTENKTENMDFSFLDGVAGEGKEAFSANDFMIPFIKLAQTTSDETKPKKEAYIEGLQPGMFFNTVTGEIFGPNIQVIVIKYVRKWYEWADGQAAPVAIHDPESIDVDKSDFSKWRNTATGNTVQDTCTFVCLVAGRENDGPVLLPMAGTKIKVAKALITNINMLKIPSSGNDAPIYGGIWQLESYEDSNDKGDFFNIRRGDGIKHIGLIKEEVFRNNVKPSIEMIESSNLFDSPSKALPASPVKALPQVDC
jgi:hypothetical protein